VLGEELAGLGRGGGRDREQEVLGRDVVVLEPVRLGEGAVEDLLQVLAEVAVGARDLGSALERALELGRERAEVHPGLLEQRRDQPVALIDERGEQVEAEDLLVPKPPGQGLGGRQRIPRFHGQSIESHRLTPVVPDRVEHTSTKR
jgi:hypothetical protein